MDKNNNTALAVVNENSWTYKTVSYTHLTLPTNSLV